LQQEHQQRAAEGVKIHSGHSAGTGTHSDPIREQVYTGIVPHAHCKVAVPGVNLSTASADQDDSTSSTSFVLESFKSIQELEEKL